MTLHAPRTALTESYLKLEPNQLVNVKIGSLSESGLREAKLLHVLA